MAIKLLLRSGKQINLLLFPVVFLFLFTTTAFAQSANQSKKIGSVTEIYQQLSSTTLNGKENSIKSLETTVATLNVVLEVNKPDLIIGKIPGNQTSSVFFDFIDGKLKGKVVIPSQLKAYNYYTDEQANVFVEEIDINNVICIGMPAAPVRGLETNTGKRSASVPSYQSLPGATAVIMMDFDGQNVSGGKWGTINAASANFTDAKIKMAWDVTAEDFRPYQVNVTTDEAVFQAAPMNRRKRCVITPTNTAAPGAGGVAYIGSFDDGNDGNVAWVFNLGGDGKTTGETVSHEIGHTVSLNHDGSPAGAYYMGHSNKLWSPIMGASYDDKVGHWSKGEYKDANNKEDDLNKIGTLNGFGYRTDDVGNTIAAAKALVVGAGGVVTAADNLGVITSSTDIDVYSFTSEKGGQVTLTVNVPNHPNLDVILKLTDASGTDVVPVVNPTTTMTASVTATLTAAGTYYLHIDGTGVADPLTTGYTDYCSIGEYTVSGTISGVTGINENSNQASFQTYPNPSSGEVTIRIINPGEKNEIKVVNMVGEVLINKTSTSGLITVDLADYAEGIYFISVANSNGTTTVKQIKE